MSYQAEVVTDEVSEHAEGPLWSVDRRSLLWVDQYRGLVKEFRPEGDDSGMLNTWSLGMTIGAIVPRQTSGWMIAAGDGFHRLDEDGGLTPVADVLPPDGVRRRMNDGKCDPLGRFWAGSMAYAKETGAGSLYRLESGTAVEVLRDVTISNGLAWDASGETLFFIDTPLQSVRQFRVTPEGLVDPRVVVDIPAGLGAPDGMSRDREGCFWVALWGGSAVQRYSPRGKLLQRIEVAAHQVSSCCFGGAGLSTLFITTSAEGYSPADLEADPNAGRIFAFQTDTVGLAPDVYRG
ncbi:MAG TPA: SMP-30/gluconolactonase/LRE family protein [Galbitalea sp.]|jgi:sugar lactone lactonase YvrE